MFIEDSEEAKNNALIAEFVAMFDVDAQNGLLDFGTLQQPRYVKFWAHSSITRLVNQTDFECIMWGTELAAAYGKDLTGTIHTKEEFGDMYERLAGTHLRAIKNKEIVYTSGELEWQNRDLKRWHRASVPILRSGEVSALAVIDFE